MPEDEHTSVQCYSTSSVNALMIVDEGFPGLATATRSAVVCTSDRAEQCMNMIRLIAVLMS